jgi:ribose-phosphate pyrophosphokinase
MVVAYVHETSLVTALRSSLPTAKFVALEARHFADTESLINVPGVEGDVILVAQFSFGVLINDQLMQILFLAQQLKVKGARKIMLVSPYLPYARQCYAVDGETAGVFQALGEFFKVVGIEKIIACELHSSPCDLPIHELSLAPVWKGVLANYGKDSCILSPDFGGLKRATLLAKMCNVSVAHVEKKRVAYDTSIALKLVGDVAGKQVVLLDDIVDTGATAVHAAELAIASGAKRVVACFTHAVLSDGAVERLEKSSIERIWFSNSVPCVLNGKIQIVSIDQEIASFVKGLS